MKSQLETPKVKPAHNIMSKPFIEKVLLSAGATGDALAKAKKLLEILSGGKAEVVTSNKRIPDFDVRPGLEVGTRITLRGKKGVSLLRQLLGAIENTLKRKQITNNHFSFGIHEYIEIPEVEYQRDIGIRGLNVTVVFARMGLRVKRKKIKRGPVPKKQEVTADEIIKYMEDHFKTIIK